MEDRHLFETKARNLTQKHSVRDDSEPPLKKQKANHQDEDHPSDSEDSEASLSDSDAEKPPKSPTLVGEKRKRDSL
jgi:hypothetical protein